ncbi:TIGR02221 family CRISPR-associated protein [Pontiella sp.]|uniref:TIGR02221 family CRISPR-associated protein n=1 Tax=Pontiella sp. TaxID=2837462 RepID=UPI00356AA1C9
MNILIMTLGKGSIEKGNRYQTARYRFGDGQVHETAFFGQALLQWLQNGGVEMDRVVILGTSGSSWDALLELGHDHGADAGNLYVEMNQAVEANTVDHGLLEKLAAEMRDGFEAEVLCRLVPAAGTAEGQYEILSAIAAAVPENSRLWMDLTHGFRHLPLLELLSAFTLEESKDIRLQGLYYGMFEKIINGETPVVELPFARELSRWTKAMHAVERGQLGALIGLPGMQPFEPELKMLILHEQLNQIAKARKSAHGLYLQLSRTPIIDSPAAELFREKLATHFRWAEGQTFALRQFHAAEKAIRLRDYIHGIILLNEALISGAIPSGVDVQNFSAREEAANNYCRTPDHHTLRILRNTLAHGTRPNGKQASKIMALMDDPENFHTEMVRLLEVIRKELNA